MKRFIAYCLCLFAFLILVIASSPRLFKSIHTILPDPYLNGDLYMMCDLKKFKQPVESLAPTYSTIKLNGLNLYILGDSYTEFMDSAYFNVNYFKFINWVYHPWIIPPLNTQKKNILIIETTERYLRKRFQLPATKHIVINRDYDPLKDKSLKPHIVAIKAEDNLSYFLTYNHFACFLKEIKAWINLTIFNRTDDQVSLSENKKHIFLKETTSPTLSTSSFYPLSDTQLDSIVQNINITYHHFLSLGFIHIYLSVIPNEVSLIDPEEGNYNHLIERLEASPKLEMPVIDIFQPFKNSPNVYYYKSDTHWNSKGYTLWLQKVDSVLRYSSAK